MYPYGNQSFMISQHNFDYPLKSDDYKVIYLRQDDCIPKMITKRTSRIETLWNTYPVSMKRKDAKIDMEQPIIFYVLYLKFFVKD